MIEIASNSLKIANMRKIRFTKSRDVIRQTLLKGSELYWLSAFGRLIHKARAE